MEFGWINLFGAIIILIMLIPNILFALKNKDARNLCKNRFMNILEQAGRYGCIILMWLPLFVMKFGFPGVFEMIIYMIGNFVLLAAYLILFAIYFKKKTAKLAIVLAILPVCIFMMSGILLRHWLLVGFSVIFAVGHIFVTIKNTKSA